MIATHTLAGFALSSLVYLALVVSGLVALTNAWPIAFTTIRLAGIVYLIYIGARMVLSNGSEHMAESTPTTARSPLLQGFITSFSNPKGLVYWTAFLAQFVDRAQAVTLQLILLGIA